MSKKRVKEALEVILTDLGASVSLIKEYFHPDYVQKVDGKTLDFEGFVAHMHSLRSKVDRLKLTFEKLFEEGENVCSVHIVDVAKKDGSNARVKVIAHFKLSGGKIIYCDELTFLIAGEAQDAQLGSCFS